MQTDIFICQSHKAIVYRIYIAIEAILKMLGQSASMGRADRLAKDNENVLQNNLNSFL